jgi:hypothetical protein
MSELDDILWSACRKLPSDYEPFGGRKRPARDETAQDCSNGCRHFMALDSAAGFTWGACANAKGPRAGLLTFHHQGCPAFERDVPEVEESLVPASDAPAMAPSVSSYEAVESESFTPKPTKSLTIKWFDLSAGFERIDSDGGLETQTYLDTETGKVLYVCSELDDCEELEEQIENDQSDRYLAIEPLEPHEEFRFMENFAVAQKNAVVRSRLVDALSRNKPFRRFKDVVFSDKELRDKWNAFHEEALMEHARDLLAARGIEPKFVRG